MEGSLDNFQFNILPRSLSVRTMVYLLIKSNGSSIQVESDSIARVNGKIISVKSMKSRVKFSLSTARVQFSAIR